MKKLLFVVLLATLSMGAFAQIRLPEVPNRAKYVDYSVRDAGFWCAAEGSVGSSLHFSNTNLWYGDLTFTGGYRFNEFLRVGLGIGIKGNFSGNDEVRPGKEVVTVPIFLNARGNIISHESREFVPYWSVNLGTALGDGFFLSPTIGLRIGQPRSSFLIGLNYTIGYVDVFRPVYSTGVNFLALKLGYEF